MFIIGKTYKSRGDGDYIIISRNREMVFAKSSNNDLRRFYPDGTYLGKDYKHNYDLLPENDEEFKNETSSLVP